MSRWWGAGWIVVMGVFLFLIGGLSEHARESSEVGSAVLLLISGVAGLAALVCATQAIALRGRADGLRRSQAIIHEEATRAVGVVFSTGDAHGFPDNYVPCGRSDCLVCSKTGTPS